MIAVLRRSGPSETPPPLGARLQLTRATLMVLCGLSVCLVVELLILSGLHERAHQQRQYDEFRAQLAAGTAPIGASASDGQALPSGAPVAYLEIPSIGLRQVVVEGTASGTMFNGPGHRRDTPLPGQAGVSIVLGRRAAFGAPFARLASLRKGALVRATTGTGSFEYRVTVVRREGDPAPAAVAAGTSRLLLATATGGPFMPTGVLRVDAELTTPAGIGPSRRVSTATLPASEQIMAGDPGGLAILVLWLQALIVVSLGATWAWRRWDRAKAWVVFLSPLVLVSLSASAEAARLLPNML